MGLYISGIPGDKATGDLEKDLMDSDVLFEFKDNDCTLEILFKKGSIEWMLTKSNWATRKHEMTPREIKYLKAALKHYKKGFKDGQVG